MLLNPPKICFFNLHAMNNKLAFKQNQTIILLALIFTNQKNKLTLTFNKTKVILLLTSSLLYLKCLM